MRELRDGFDATRKSGTREIRRRFILFFEGYRTEVQYFKGLKDNKQQCGLSSLIDIHVMCRYPTQAGLSDPLGMLDLIDDYLEFLNYGEYTPELLANTYLHQQLSDEFISSQHMKSNSFIENAVQSPDVLKDSRGFIIDLRKALDICDEIFVSVFQKDPCAFEPPYTPDYDKDRDAICVLIDRDKESRTVQKIHEFFTRCKECGYLPFVTNPCFEFWLLLHFDEVIHMDKGAIESNLRENGKSHVERELDVILRNYIPNEGYDKANLNCQQFIHRLNDAMRNERYYCTDLKCINHSIGSNIGSLIRMMRE